MRIFNFLLRLYPPEYKRLFAPEMLMVLEAAHERYRGKGAPCARFVLTESFGLIRGAVVEWFVRFTAGNYIDDQSLTDQVDNKEVLPTEVMEAQKRIKFILRKMEQAIANHQFEKARFFSEEERKERESLRLLQQKYQLPHSL